MKPKITETTTDMYIPTAAMREALVGLLGHVRRGVEARDRVLGHQEAEAEHEPEDRVVEAGHVVAVAGCVHLLAEHVAEPTGGGRER